MMKEGDMREKGGETSCISMANSDNQDREGTRLTLRRTVCQTSSGDRAGDGRSDIDDASSFLFYPLVERTFVGVLRVDRIGHASVDNKCSVRVHHDTLFEVLRAALRSVWDRERTSLEAEETYLATIHHLVRPRTRRCDGCTVDPSEQASLRDQLERFRACLGHGVDIRNIGLDVERLVR